MKKIYINGRYLTDDISGGVERFSRECVKALSKHKDLKIIVLCPKNAHLEPNTENVVYKRIGFLKGNLWEQICLPFHMLFKKSYLLNMGNAFPIFRKKSAVVLHDMKNIEELRAGDDCKKNKKFDLMVRKSNKKKTKVFVDSAFTMHRLKALYPKYKNRINVLNLGYEHCKDINYDADLDIKLKNKEYFLTVNSLSKHKNADFIFKLANIHKDKSFYVIGKKFDETTVEIPNNVLFLGKISDSQMASYYKNCKAFISPSLYEGFGLTPLEAIYYGAKNVYLSDIEVFREIYEGIATFFDPYDESRFTFTDSIIAEDKRDALLEKYSWDVCANQIVNEIFKK